MRRLKKKIYFGAWGVALVVLAGIRWIGGASSSDADAVADTLQTAPVADTLQASAVADTLAAVRRPHRILSVPSYAAAFPDGQDVQLRAAQKWGVSPVADRQQAERRKSELAYIGGDPFYTIDNVMRSSIPYLVPRAASLLHDIGRAYLDSLYVKGVPLHKVIVTSVLRTEADVNRLKSHNFNAMDQSCHRYGTTFDICYNRYETVSPPSERRRSVANDTLKWVLSEVLRDKRAEGRCYVKHEVKQGCFHITTR